MRKRIYCLTCARVQPALTKEDVFNGYKERSVFLEVRTPARHGFELAGRFTPRYEVQCDQCHETLHNGDRAVAMTHWCEKGAHAETEPEAWENEFGLI